MRRASLQVQLSQLLRAMSQMADVSEGKDFGHGQRVAVLAQACAEAVGLDGAAERANLAVSSLLHDLGMSSVSYHLYERFGGSDREWLARYPDYRDGLFGVETLDASEREGLQKQLLRHVRVGVRHLGKLGYGPEVQALLEGHHGTAEPSVSLQVLQLADLLDVATSPLGTVAERRARAEHMLSACTGRGIEASVVDAVRGVLTTTELWERVLFLDDIEGMLKGLFETTLGVRVSSEVIEAHLNVVGRVVDAQSPFMGGHTFEVSRLARRMGEQMGLDAEALSRLLWASLVHGAGRLGISSAILEKTGGLSEDEFNVLYSYPNLTREIFAPLRGLEAIVDEASTHREKLDGSGYPDGRVGSEIPLTGRILGVADTFIALISDRPYRAAYSRSRALAIIQAESARLFDGLVTDALESVYREGF